MLYFPLILCFISPRQVLKLGDQMASSAVTKAALEITCRNIQKVVLLA